MSEAKPFCISKWEVWEAYKRVKANKGAAGVDEQTIEDFEKKLKKNLYKIWNRMSSGSYFPPPVRTVKIPKANGGERKLGIPTVSDRIAQQVVKSRLEPEVDRLFHADSYGYRPGKSALEAVGRARERCWRYDWVLDLDIKGFFDNIDQNLLMRAVKKHAKDRWSILYIVYCRTEREALTMRKAIAERLQNCGLELHPDKTKIVYCKDDDRTVLREPRGGIPRGYSPTKSADPLIQHCEFYCDS
jgi:retron-type reverse transcriptase